MSNHFRAQDEYEKEFVGIVNDLSYTRQKWQVWEDLITAISCTISNVLDREPERWEKREQLYRDSIHRLGDADKAARAYAIIVEALENNPDQDFLGSLYMRLELGSHWHGQFFTPYSLCHLMAKVQMPDPKAEVEKRGWISICDPAIGGGAMMIAAVTQLRTAGVNYHDHVLFVGQDVDSIAGRMAYIQLSLLGCPGYIVIANTLSNPITGNVLCPDIREGQDFWFMPFFFRQSWDIRRRYQVMERVLGLGRRKEKLQKAQEAIKQKERYVFFFNFGGAYDTGTIKADC